MKFRMPFSPSPGDRSSLRWRNWRVAAYSSMIIFVMIGVVVASPTLYSIFCQVTGYGGTVGRAETQAEKILSREMTIRFDANTDPSLPWYFRPKQKTMRVKLGETKFAYYESHNEVDYATTGMAVFNVTPLKVGPYFKKIQCFCFNLQNLGPNQKADMPLQFFVDPALNEDPNMHDVQTITLSYTFFAQDEEREETETSNLE